MLYFGIVIALCQYLYEHLTQYAAQLASAGHKPSTRIHFERTDDAEPKVGAQEQLITVRTVMYLDSTSTTLSTIKFGTFSTRPF